MTVDTLLPARTAHTSSCSLLLLLHAAGAAHLKLGLALRCSTSATSSTTGPRAALTSTASSFIIPSRSLLIRCVVVSSSAQCRLTTCRPHVLALLSALLMV